MKSTRRPACEINSAMDIAAEKVQSELVSAHRNFVFWKDTYVKEKTLANYNKAVYAGGNFVGKANMLIDIFPQELTWLEDWLGANARQTIRDVADFCTVIPSNLSS